MIVLSRSLPVVQTLPNVNSAVKFVPTGAGVTNLTMQQVTLLCVCLLGAVLAAPAPQMSDAQLEQTLASRGTMQRHLRCALAEGPCDPVGRRLRTLAPLVLRGACPQCSAQETRQIRRTLAFVQRNYPWEWAKIVRQYG